MPNSLLSWRCGVANPVFFVASVTVAGVLYIMAARSARGPASARGVNPICILSHMAAHDDVTLCPLIYGYVNYAAPASGTKPIAFTDAPRETADSAPGSTLGGTGIGISARCAEIGRASCRGRVCQSV